MEPIEIITGDLVLRPWRAEDAPAVARACQDPQIARWTAVPAPYELSHAIDFVERATPAAWAAGTQAQFGVFGQATGELLGACGLVAIEPRLTSAEIGYWTAPWARGRGVAVAAARAVCTWALDTLGVRRVVWQAEVGNHASRLVALRTGFRIEGELRLSNPHRCGRHEAWVGSLLPGEVTAGTPEAYATSSLVARQATLFGAAQPEIALEGVAGRLRPLRATDIDGVTATCQDPQTARWTTVPQPYARRDAQWFVTEHAMLTWARGRGAYFAIADPDDRFAGSIDLRLDPHDPVDAEVGFSTAPWARGRGYMTAAVRAICRWGFDAMALDRIAWRAFTGNDASRRIAEKAGFTWEGTMRGDCLQRGVRRDSWAASILAGELR